MTHTEYRRIVTDNDYTDVGFSDKGIGLSVSTIHGDFANLVFEEPEAFSRFLLSIAESDLARDFLAKAGAGFSLTVEPLPQPVEVK